MLRLFRATLILLLIITPIYFHHSFRKQQAVDPDEGPQPLLSIARDTDANKPVIAIIFDDLGESLSELKDIHALGIPLSISVIPDLKFSRNIAHIGARCGYSVLIHLPLEPHQGEKYATSKYEFIGPGLSQFEVERLLRQYLNSIRIAIGVNNHMGSLATEDAALMAVVMKAIKTKDLIFIDSRTSTDSLAYEVASRQGLTCAYSEGFIDSLEDVEGMRQNFHDLIATAQKKGAIIAIAHPKKTTIDFLKQEIPEVREKVDFITIKEYFQR
jgi:uncharacterized protein